MLFYALVGLISGIIITSVKNRIPQQRNYKIIFYFILSFPLTIIVIDTIDNLNEVYSISLFFRRVFFPAIVGFALGLWAGTLLRYLPRKFEAAAWIPLWIAILLVTLVLIDDEYRLFDRLQKVAIGGSELSFQARTEQHRNSDRAMLSITSELSTTGASKVDTLISHLIYTKEYIERDIGYYNEYNWGNDRLDVGEEINFAKKVLKPLGESIAQLHKKQRYNSPEYIIKAEEIHMIRQIAKRDQNLDVKIINTISTFLNKFGIDESHAKIYINDYINNDRKSPYIIIISSSLLFLNNEPEAAVSDLMEFSTKISNDSPNLFLKYRAIAFAIDIIFRSDSRAIANKRLLEIDLFKELIALRNRIILKGKAHGQKHFWADQVEKIGNKLDVMQCRYLESESLQRILSFDINITNNFVYALAEHDGTFLDEGLRNDLLTYTDKLSKFNFTCLRGMDPNKNAEAYNFYVAAYKDTIAFSKLRLAIHATDRKQRRSYACAAIAESRASRVAHARSKQSLPNNPMPNNQSAFDQRIEMAANLARDHEFQSREQHISGFIAAEGIRC